MKRASSHLSADGNHVDLRNKRVRRENSSSGLEAKAVFQPGPGYTDGLAKFIETKEGDKDCLALLVTETFIDQMGSLLNHADQLSKIAHLLRENQAEVSRLKQLVEDSKRRLQDPDNGLLVEEAQKSILQQEATLKEACSEREELEKTDESLRTEISISRAHTDWVLKTAMQARGLLKPKKDCRPPTIDEDKHTRSKPHAETHRPTQNIRPTETPQQRALRQAYEDLRNCEYKLENLRYQFDDKDRIYDEKLAEYRHKVRMGEYTESELPRSEFDRRMVAYGQALTGDLIQAEVQYEKALERVKALDENLYDDGSQGSGSREEAEFCITSVDRGFIEAWRSEIPSHAYPYEHSRHDRYRGDSDLLVDISDSVSARDEGEYRKQIDKWQGIRGIREGTNRRRPDDRHAQRRGRQYAPYRRR